MKGQTDLGVSRPRRDTTDIHGIPSAQQQQERQNVAFSARLIQVF